MAQDEVVERVRERLTHALQDPSWCWDEETLLSAEEAAYLKRWHLPFLSEGVLPLLVELELLPVETGDPWGALDRS